jgi:hypothetical protein
LPRFAASPGGNYESETCVSFFDLSSMGCQPVHCDSATRLAACSTVNDNLKKMMCADYQGLSGCIRNGERLVYPSTLLPVLELIVEHRVPADEWYLPPVDEEVTDVCSRLQHITVGDDQVGDFALLD